MAESVSLHEISEAKMPSLERRFARFVANKRIVVNEVWRQFLTQVLPYWQGKPVRLVLDCTPCGNTATIVSLGLLVHSRILPVLWRVMPLQESGHEAQWTLVSQMLEHVQSHLQGVRVYAHRHGGLSGAPLVQLCQDQGWRYLLRICKEHTVRRKLGKRFAAWTACEAVVHKAGQQWFGRVLCWQESTIETYLSAVWDWEYLCL